MPFNRSSQVSYSPVFFTQFIQFYVEKFNFPFNKTGGKVVFFTLFDPYFDRFRYQHVTNTLPGTYLFSVIFLMRNSPNHMVKEVLSLIVSAIWLCKIGYRQEGRTEQTPSWKYSFTLTEIMMIT